MAATLLFAARAAAVCPGPVDEALWYARALGWAVLPDSGAAGTAEVGAAFAGNSGNEGDDPDIAVNATSTKDATRFGGGTAAPTTDPKTILRHWTDAAGGPARHPVRLATGVRFDVLDAPGAAGTRALRRAERLGLPLGPVAATVAGRVQFFVAPGVAEDLPQLLDWLDWSDLGLDLRAYGPGDSVPAPSPWPATWQTPWPLAWESARWLRPPAASRLRCLPGAGTEGLLRVDVRFPDVTRLLSGLADACQRVRLLPRQRGAERRLSAVAG